VPVNTTPSGPVISRIIPGECSELSVSLGTEIRETADALTVLDPERESEEEVVSAAFHICKKNNYAFAEFRPPLQHLRKDFPMRICTGYQYHIILSIFFLVSLYVCLIKPVKQFVCVS
jgi:hypothetical protein